MKRILLAILSATLVTAATAQPAKRRSEATPQAAGQPAAAKQVTRNAPSGVSYRDFPTAQAMPSDVSWRRDIYRALDLTKDANASLYYPTMPQDGRMNLFSYLFKLLLRKQIKAYDTKLDANEDFSPSNEVSAKELMDRYKMFYEVKDGRMRVNDADIPSDEVKMYYIKESVYYNQHTATFHSRVTALCPVLLRGDTEFGGTDARYPMFWVKFDDIAPQLGKLMLMGSNYNNAAMMSADDFFTLNRYEGEIYRTVNLQDRLLSNYCETDSDMVREQRKIEKELSDFQEHVWGRDSVAVQAEEEPEPEMVIEDPDAASDSVAVAAPRPIVRRTPATRRAPAAKPKAARPAKQKDAARKKQKRTGAARSGSGSGFSVRRERH